MRQTITVKSIKEYKQEEEKIYQLIKNKMNDIGQQNQLMTRIEAQIQAILELMNEERIPLIVLNHKINNDKQTPTIDQALLMMKFQSHMRGMTRHIMETENLNEEEAKKKAWETLQPQYKEQLENPNN